MNQKVALVTGASSGIGTAIVLSLAEDGYFVMAAGRDTARTEQICKQCTNAQSWIGDITSAESCVDLVSACIERFGRLDLLVNNAGVYHAANAELTSDEIWLQTMAINLNAPFYLSREAMPHLRETKGAILNIASDWGLVGGKEAVAYCASKGGIVLVTKAMALDHAHEGVRVNAICPGDVETPMLYADGAAHGLGPEEAVRAASKASPTGKVTAPDEVAALVVFLASDAAAQITGAAIPIDGGNTAWRLLVAESGSSIRRILSGAKDRYTSEAAMHILVAEKSVRISASHPIAALELLVSWRAADDPMRTCQHGGKTLAILKQFGVDPVKVGAQQLNKDNN